MATFASLEAWAISLRLRHPSGQQIQISVFDQKSVDVLHVVTVCRYGAVIVLKNNNSTFSRNSMRNKQARKLIVFFVTSLSLVALAYENAGAAQRDWLVTNVGLVL